MWEIYFHNAPVTFNFVSIQYSKVHNRELLMLKGSVVLEIVLLTILSPQVCPKLIAEAMQKQDCFIQSLCASWLSFETKLSTSPRVHPLKRRCIITGYETTRKIVANKSNNQSVRLNYTIKRMTKFPPTFPGIIISPGTCIPMQLTLGVQSREKWNTVALSVMTLKNKETCFYYTATVIQFVN